MDYLPIFAQLKCRSCLLVGGGDVALRKARALSNVGAVIHLVALEVLPELKQLVEQGGGSVEQRAFKPEDMADVFLVIAATNDRDLHQYMADLAQAQQRLINVVDQPELCSFIFPAIIDRSPLIIAAATGGNAPVLSRLIRTELEQRFPARYGDLARWSGEWREGMKSAFPEMMDRRRAWEEIIQGPIAEQVLQGKPDKANLMMNTLLAEGKTSQGEVYLVGAGPGDPDLLTFKALRLMQQSEVVLYDRLVAPEIVAMCRRDADYVYVGKKRDKHTLPQEEINELLVYYAKKGLRVCRLKGGDPFVFGRGGEEIDLLSDHQIPFQVVPGITAATGCSSYSGIPLTHRDYAHSVRFITGHLKADELPMDYKKLIVPKETLVFYMALAYLEEVIGRLLEAGLNPQMPVALIEKGTKPEQRVLVSSAEQVVKDVQESGLKPPAILIIGEVVSLHEKLQWR
ncbi:MAG: siroheme synthase CysG [Pseudomonadota bacterium]|nr:siroheme synthase CysG [Pseudomonadota bacterium]